MKIFRVSQCGKQEVDEKEILLLEEKIAGKVIEENNEPD